MYWSSTSSGIRNALPGYSASLDRKKQYVQSRLQTAPLGLARTWNAPGAPRGRGSGTAGETGVGDDPARAVSRSWRVNVRVGSTGLARRPSVARRRRPARRPVVLVEQRADGHVTVAALELVLRRAPERPQR